MSEKKAVHVMIRGRVQGVCFRMETRKAAIQVNVRGWVKNRPDGAVEGVFEGTPENVEALINWCRRGPRMASVSDVVVRDLDYTGEYEDFSIRYE
ncbi:MAG: acylphosphatase [Desulfobacteraceae bacterium]|nr:MAG: acylphosphatase [Desulfobacteraceae bacterium]